MEPHTGLIPQPQDHNPRQNQELESQPTVPPRRPFTLSCCNPLVCASPGCPARSIPLCVSCVHKIIKGKQKPEDASLLSEREGKLSSSTTKGQNHTFSETWTQAKAQPQVPPQSQWDSRHLERPEVKQARRESKDEDHFKENRRLVMRHTLRHFSFTTNTYLTFWHQPYGFTLSTSEHTTDTDCRQGNRTHFLWF